MAETDKKPQGFYDSTTGEYIGPPSEPVVSSDGKYGYDDLNGNRVEFVVRDGKKVNLQK